MTTRKRLIETILVMRVDGTTDAVYRYEHSTLHQPLAGPERWIPAGESFELADGSTVKAQPDGTFNSRGSGEIIRRA